VSRLLPRRRPSSALLLAVALALGAAGCGIPSQKGPSTIGASKVPFDLLSPQLPSTTTTQPNAASFVPVKVFFLSPSDQLQPAQRVVQTPAPLTSIITSMLAGPDKAETAADITTAIPDNVRILSAGPALGQTGQVTVNFNQAFSQITGNFTELAVAQVVATVAAEDGLGTGVVFEIDGQRTSVPIASGASVPGPVYLLQFISAAR
jgi:hypothetical protein